jgi:hypothetical protein
MITAGRELRRAREARRMTLMKGTIAAREYGLPIGVSSLSRFERDEVPIPLGEFLCLARAVRCDAERVLAGRPCTPELGDDARAGLERLADDRDLRLASDAAAAHVLGAARESAASGGSLYAGLLLAALRGLGPDPGAAPSWMSNPRLNELAGRIALACHDGPLAMDHFRRASWSLESTTRPDAPRALRVRILWAEAAVIAGGHKSALSTLRRILAGRPGGLDGWLACDVAAEACARGGELTEARRFTRRALARADRSTDLKLLTWFRSNRIELRFGQQDRAAHAARTARRVLAQEIAAEVRPSHIAPLLDDVPPTRHELVALRLLSLFD